MVLHRLVAIVKAELKSLVPDFAASMLQPPNQRVSKNYYNGAVFQEHKTYFKKEMVKKESNIHSYQYTGNYRPTDKVCPASERASEQVKQRYICVHV